MKKVKILHIVFCLLAFHLFADNHDKHKHLHSPSGQPKKVLLENKGQWPEGVLFRSNLQGGKLWVQQNKFVYHLQDYSSMQKAHAKRVEGFNEDVVKETVVHLNFLGSNKVTDIVKNGKSKEYYNFFKGNDQRKWAADIHSYESVTLKEFYDKTDLHLSGNEFEAKYEFILKPGADPSKIKLNYAGQEKISIDEKQNLVISTSVGQIIEYKPIAYQLINGNKFEVTCNFKIDGENIVFDLGNYNSQYELVIDPTLVFATYVGAISDNFGMTATYGNDGTAYSGGTVYGNNYPNPDPLAYDVNSNFTVVNASYGITDVFISKYSADGTQMIWGTFIGGGNNNQGTETIHSMICDLQDNLYFFGATSSNDFPITAGAFDASFNGGNTTYNTNFYYNGVYFQNLGTDIYVAKLSANGHNLMGSTYVGGNGNDGVNYEQLSLPYDFTSDYNGLNSNYGDQSRGEIMLDANNNILVASCTRSTNFPTVTPIQGTFGGIQDGVIFKLNGNFSNLLFSSYYGGSARDACYSVKLDNAQNVVFAGGTQSNNLQGISGTWQPLFAGGTDGFVVKLPSAGNTITAASYVGKGGYDQVFFVEIDRYDNIFLLGQSVGSAGNGYMPITNAAYFNGNSSNFIIKFNPALTSIFNSTRFGNGSTAIHISPAAFLVDNCGNIYVSGWGANILQSTPLSGMPVTADAFQGTPPDGFDFYLFVLKGDFNTLMYATYLGGNQADEHVDGGTSRFDKNGIVYQSVCGGCGGSSDFPTTPGAWSSTNNSSNCNNIIYKFSTGLMPEADFIPDQTAGCADFQVVFDNFSTSDDSYVWDFGNGNLDSTTFNPTVLYTTAGSYTVNLYVTDRACLLTDTARITINVFPKIVTNLDSVVNVCGPNPYVLTVNSQGTGDYFIWSNSPSFSPALNAPTDSSITVNSTGTYYVEVGNQFCLKRDTVVLTVAPITVGVSLLSNSGCAPFNATFQANLNVNNADSLVWNFTNTDSIRTSASVTTQTFNYANAGTYTVSLTAFNEGCSATDVATVTVNPQIVAALDTIKIPCSTTVSFADITPETINSWSWNFGDDSTSTIQSPTHTYASNGNYTVTLVVTSALGCIDSVQIPVQFALTPDSVGIGTIYCADSIVPIQLFSNGGTTYSWLPIDGLSDPAIANPVASPSVTTVYTVTISELDLDGNTCASTKTLTIDVNPEVLADFNPVIQPCSNTFDFGNLSSGPVNNWSWDFGDSNVSSDQNPTHTYAGNGDYTVTLVVESAQGCNDTVFIPVKININPDTIGPGAVFCADSISPVPLFASGGVTYEWTPSAGLTDSTIANPIALPDQTTTYSVTITEYDFGGNACATTQTVTIQIKPGVTADFTFTADPCNNTFQFNDASFGNVTSWSWDFGDSNSSITQSPSHTYATPGTYPVSLIIQNAEGCNDTIGTPVFLGSFGPVSVSGPQTICFGQQAQLNASGGVAYQWIPATGLSDPNIPNPVANPSSTTNYSVIITTVSSIGDSCSRELTTGITVPTLQSNQLVTTANPDTIYAGDYSNLSSNIGPPLNILWSPPYQLSSTTDYNPTASPLSTTTYAAVAEDASGCKFLLDSVTIYVLSKYCDESTVYVPNTFTPNGDGVNDVLYARSNFIMNIYFAVYNRWGELVFETTDLSKGWDGMYKGMKVDPGVFGYYLRYDCTNDLKGFKKGNVTLIR